MSGFIDFTSNKNCYNPFESHGMICVGCGCCSEDELKAAKARLALHQRLLEENESFDRWFDDNPEVMELQKRNIESKIKWNKERIAYYQAVIDRRC